MNKRGLALSLEVNVMTKEEFITKFLKEQQRRIKVLYYEVENFKMDRRFNERKSLGDIKMFLLI